VSANICYLCGCSQYLIRPGVVRDDARIKVHECIDCGLVYLSSFDHITEFHYESSGMHEAEAPDVDGWLKATADDDERRYQFAKEKITNKSVLDFGCGVGGFMERAKCSASLIAGIELEKSLEQSFEKRGLVVFPSLESVLKKETKWDLITAFHVVEHLSDPIATLKDLSTLLSEGGELVVEVPNSDDALLTFYECGAFQQFTYWSQHLFLFNANTLGNCVKQAGLKLNWIKHIQRYPLSNHLYWLSSGKPGGHQKWGVLNDKNLNSSYEHQLASIGKTDTIIAGLSK